MTEGSAGKIVGMRMRVVAVAVVVGAVLTLGGIAPSRALPETPSADSERFALVVGVSDYSGRTKSTVAGAADADDFREALLRNGFRSDNILLLTEKRATAANIRAGLQWLIDNSSENSFSVFHFSGHVKQIGGDRDRDGEKLDEYLWPYDNRFISDAELANKIRELRGLSWTDIAGCEAAGFDDRLSGPSRLFTSSSAEHEKSYEFPAWNNSIFTGLEIDEAFLQGLGDRDGNGKVSIQEAFAHAYERAPQLTSRQKRGAQHPRSSGGTGPEWFLDGPPQPPAPEPDPGGPTASGEERGDPPPERQPCTVFCL